MAQTGIPAEAFGRLYVASSQIGHAIVRCRSREELLREVVRTLVESAGFAMAAISWHDPASHELIPVAAFGDDAGYTSRVRIFTDERPEGRGPGGTAFREDAPCFCNDFLNDPRTQVWREAARASGWRASAAIPIRMGGKPRGLLSVYAREIGFFGRKESELVLEVAGDVAIGLERLDAEEHRCLAEAALSASERRLKLALDAAEIGTFDWDTGTGKSAWGGHFDRLFGFATGEFDGSWPCLERRLHPDDLPGLLRTVQAACDTHTPFVIEFRVLWTGGDIRWVGAHGEFYYGPSGRPARVYGAVRDITEQKRAATALHESEERLRQAIRVSDIGIFDHDHLTDIIYWSPQQRAIHGWGPEEPVTLPAYLLRVHDEDRARIAMAVRRAHDPAGDGLFDVEYRMLFPNGSVRWARVRSQTFFAGDGGGRRPVRTVGAVTDITERKQAEEEQKKLASVVEMSGEFIGIATLEGQVVYLNNAALALAGLESMEEARGKTIFDFFADSHLAQARDEMYGSVQTAGAWHGESRFRHFMTGGRIDVEITAFQIRDDSGAPLYLATVTRDITERKKAEADQARLKDELFQAQKMESIGRLAGGVAHDFNNMLTVILGYAGLIKSKSSLSSQCAGYLDEIERAANRSQEITRQLLGFSRRQIIAPKPVVLNSLLAELQDPLARLIGEDIEFRFHPQAALWTALLDPSQVNQILLNLVVNARDAMPHGGKLTIETANLAVSGEPHRARFGCKAGEYVTVSVSDNGSGMSEETMAHMFEPFFTTKGAGKGSGLGLATVYGIVRQNGGFVDVDSVLGQGTTVKIYFPRCAEESAAHEPGASGGVIAGSGAILLVEDDELLRGLTTDALSSLGYTPLVAASGEEALELCGRPETRLRLVITDVVMPGMSGVELRDRMRTLRPDLKVLFMSGYASDVIANRGVLMKGVHYIQKPFSIEELAAKIAETLRSA